MTSLPTWNVRDKTEDDRTWIEDLLSSRWGSSIIVAHGERFNATALPGLVVDGRHGLATYQIDEVAELITLGLVDRWADDREIQPVASTDIAVENVTQMKRKPEVGNRLKRYWGRHFWAKGYFSTTSGNITDDVILQYLENHIDDPTDASR